MPDLAVELTFTWKTKNKVIHSSIHGHLLVSVRVGGCGCVWASIMCVYLCTWGSMCVLCLCVHTSSEPT